jgi:hypothetical protein
MIEELSTPILSGGIRHPNYFNGRVLTADALQREQEAIRRITGAVGRSIGEGVVHGFEVEPAPAVGGRPVVRIHPGLAVNRSGQVLVFEPDGDYVELGLVRVAAGAATGAGVFGECAPPEPDALPTGTDVFILTAMPASAYEERTASVDLDTGRGAGCGSRYVTRGIQFRLVRLAITSSGAGSIGQALRLLMDAPGPLGNTRFRNLLAHYCLGTADRMERSADLYRTATRTLPEEYGPLDTLRGNGRLTRCDVPLAILFWTPAGLSFVDPWPVRRSLASRYEGLEPSTDRADAERLATEAQFRQHIELIVGERSTAQMAGTSVRTLFRFLPAAGMLPLAEASFRGITPDTFFRDVPVRGPYFVEAAEVPALFAEARRYEPLDLDTGVHLWLYHVRENRQAPSGRRPFLVFTAGYVPFRSEARYEVSRWNFSHYSRGVSEKPILEV